MRAVCENGSRSVGAGRPADGELRSGRLAQRERRTLTRSRSGVQIPHRPPLKPQAIGLFARWPCCFPLSLCRDFTDAPRQSRDRPRWPSSRCSPSFLKQSACAPGRPSIANSSSAERRYSTMGCPINRRARRQRHPRARFSMRSAKGSLPHLASRTQATPRRQLPTCSSCVRMAFAFDPRWIRGGNAFDPPLLHIGSIGLAGEAAVPSGHDTLARWAPPRLGPAARSE